jgi:hypothetical protein
MEPKIKNSWNRIIQQTGFTKGVLHPSINGDNHSRIAGMKTDWWWCKRTSGRSNIEDDLDKETLVLGKVRLSIH